jgi:hypothetical protein
MIRQWPCCPVLARTGLFDFVGFLRVAISPRAALSRPMLWRPVAIPVAKFGASNLSIERREETLILKRNPDNDDLGKLQRLF